MKKTATFMLVAAAAVVLVARRIVAESENSGNGRRTAAMIEDGGERGLTKTREDHEDRTSTAREELPSVAWEEERAQPLVVHAGRVVGYAFLLVVVFAACVALGAGIAVGMEYLVGWPDTWWL